MIGKERIVRNESQIIRKLQILSPFLEFNNSDANLTYDIVIVILNKIRIVTFIGDSNMWLMIVFNRIKDKKNNVQRELPDITLILLYLSGYKRKKKKWEKSSSCLSNPLESYFLLGFLRPEQENNRLWTSDNRGFAVKIAINTHVIIRDNTLIGFTYCFVSEHRRFRINGSTQQTVARLYCFPFSIGKFWILTGVRILVV